MCVRTDVWFEVSPTVAAFRMVNNVRVRSLLAASEVRAILELVSLSFFWLFVLSRNMYATSALLNPCRTRCSRGWGKSRQHSVWYDTAVCMCGRFHIKHHAFWIMASLHYTQSDYSFHGWSLVILSTFRSCRPALLRARKQLYPRLRYAATICH